MTTRRHEDHFREDGIVLGLDCRDYVTEGVCRNSLQSILRRMILLYGNHTSIYLTFKKIYQASFMEISKCLPIPPPQESSGHVIVEELVVFF